MVAANLERVRQQRLAAGIQHHVSQPTRSEVGDPGGKGERQAFRIKEIQTDTLLCRTWDGTTEGATDVTVMRPFHLQYSPFHQRQMYGQWFDFSGKWVDPFTFAPIIDPETGLPRELYPANYVNRLVFNYGEGRDKFQNRVVEWAVLEPFPPYPLGPDPTIPTGPDPAVDPPGIEYADPETIWGAPIDAHTVGGVTAKFIETTTRMLYVASRVFHNASPEVQ